MELPISNPVFASLLFSETAFKTNVEKIIDRFVVDAAYANDVMSKELELKKTHVATVNAFITVVRNALSFRDNFLDLRSRY